MVLAFIDGVNFFPTALRNDQIPNMDKLTFSCKTESGAEFVGSLNSHAVTHARIEGETVHTRSVEAFCAGDNHLDRGAVHAIPFTAPERETVIT